MKLNSLHAVAAVATSFLASIVTAHAQTPSRLDKIKAEQTISIGSPTSSLPFAFMDGNQKMVGYSIEICQRVTDIIKSSLAVPKVDIRYVPVTSATRLQLLANGTIDLECGNTTNTAERHQFVDFAPTTFVAKVVLLGKKDSKLDMNDVQAFKGKTVTSLSGGLNLAVIQKINAEQKLGMSVVPVKDAPESFLSVKTSRAAATVADDGMAYALVATSGAPDDYVIGTKALVVAPYGIVIPKDDLRFKKAVDAAIVSLIKSGEVAKIYDKYFNAPVPPHGINLKYPMSAELKKALANPTDSPDPKAYE
ncbi:amino acid ABC transporter substrate-binding protein [Variovorax sp. Root434]|uniref:amino acid ABC transporter substrate-binding protein n=1 Tax=Variovorax sp. Root434 TaxID=1736536 RepID=UPI0006F20EF5|nr:amino acid ABC transporter substrate-binding protein [Variovorax sp. Root434]KQX21324.1 ABC transporter [Variovorax sp. Root434]